MLCHTEPVMSWVSAARCEWAIFAIFIADPRCWKAILLVKFVNRDLCGQKSSSFSLLHKFITATDVWYAGFAAVAAKHRVALGVVPSRKRRSPATTYRLSLTNPRNQ